MCPSVGKFRDVDGDEYEEDAFSAPSGPKTMVSMFARAPRRANGPGRRRPSGFCSFVLFKRKYWRCNRYYISRQGLRPHAAPSCG